MKAHFIFGRTIENLLLLLLQILENQHLWSRRDLTLLKSNNYEEFPSHK